MNNPSRLRELDSHAAAALPRTGVLAFDIRVSNLSNSTRDLEIGYHALSATERLFSVID